MGSSGAALGKVLPHNDNAERALLGAILIDNSKLADVLSVTGFTSGDFFVREHGVIFSQMLALKDAGEGIDLVTVADALSRAKKMDWREATSILSPLIDGVPMSINAASYARIVRQYSRARVLVHVAENIQARAWENRDDIEELERQLRDALEPVKTHENVSGVRRPYYKLMNFLNTDFPVPEHLVEGLIPAHGASVLIQAMPHRLKSFLTTGLALACTSPGENVLGCLVVKRPVRTMLVQIEEHEGDLKGRIKNLMASTQFLDCDPEAVGIIGREQFTKFTPEWAQWLREQCRDHRADLVVLDVVRRFFVGWGNLNDPADSANFLEEIDLLRDEGPTVTLVHHVSKKDAELMAAAAGSFNFAGWANVVIELKRKTEKGKGAEKITTVELEADNKLGHAPEGLRIVLQLHSPNLPLRIEEIGDGDDIEDAKEQLSSEGDWSLRDIMEIYGIARSSAQRRLKRWIAVGKVQKVTGHRGHGGMARYHWA